jgi:pyruvate dehydrogenase E2 component (dihydrolipoamide acetyltransferase)
MEKGNISVWHKKVGDKVKPGEALCGVETDKATVDFEMQEEGYIAKLCYPAGTKDIALGQAVAILVDDPKNIPAFADWVMGGKAAAAAQPAT